MATPKLKSTAVLIGYNPDGQCVYNEILEMSDYYDGDHVWDDGASIKTLKLHRVNGNLDQEFESVFDPSTGN